MVIAVRQPKPGLLVHPNRGSQYASDAHRKLLAAHGFVASMSRLVNCRDNSHITDYIVGFYNATQLTDRISFGEFNQTGASARTSRY
jgi:transposase InsO family protein